MAGELAERRGIPLTDARALLAAVDLTMPVAVEQFIGPARGAPGTGRRARLAHLR